jgi:hypothetical protein
MKIRDLIDNYPNKYNKFSNYPNKHNKFSKILKIYNFIEEYFNIEFNIDIINEILRASGTNNIYDISRKGEIDRIYDWFLSLEEQELRSMVALIVLSL